METLCIENPLRLAEGHPAHMTTWSGQHHTGLTCGSDSLCPNLARLFPIFLLKQLTPHLSQPQMTLRVKLLCLAPYNKRS